MIHLLFPGRHLVNARFQEGYLERLFTTPPGQLAGLIPGRCEVPAPPAGIVFAYAINGEINSAEIYNNKGLFRALWPKLLDAAVTEAITEYRADRTFTPVESGAVKRFFETALSGTVEERLVWKSTKVRTTTTPTTVLFETLDVEAKETWIHKSFVHRGTDAVVVPLDRESSRRGPQSQR